MNLHRFKKLGLSEMTVKGELTKFVIEGSTRGAMRHGELRAYVSKNIGSFFAKAAAGICTAEGIPLFEL